MANLTDEDIHRLKNFVTKVYLWLSYCYLGKPNHNEPSPWPVIRVRSELRDFAVLAWLEFSKEYPLERLLEPINNSRESVLLSHGLYGDQLRYKLQLVELAARNVKGGKRGWRKKLIELIDNIIDSLGPTGIAGGLKELKDALTASL